MRNELHSLLPTSTSIVPEGQQWLSPEDTGSFLGYLEVNPLRNLAGHPYSNAVGAAVNGELDGKLKERRPPSS